MIDQGPQELVFHHGNETMIFVILVVALCFLLVHFLLSLPKEDPKKPWPPDDDQYPPRFPPL